MGDTTSGGAPETTDARAQHCGGLHRRRSRAGRCRSSRAGRSVRDRCRLRPAHRAGARAARGPRGRVISTPSPPTRSRSRRPAGALVERHPAEKDRDRSRVGARSSRGHGSRAHRRHRRCTAAGSITSSPTPVARPRPLPRCATLGVHGRCDACSWCVITSRLHGAVGDVVTLLPLHGPAIGVDDRGAALPVAGRDARPRARPEA